MTQMFMQCGMFVPLFAKENNTYHCQTETKDKCFKIKEETPLPNIRQASKDLRQL